MAANIFNQNDYQQITERISRLHEQSAKQWGKMNLPQTLEHCAIQLKMGLGMMPDSSKAGPAIFRTAFGKWMGLYAFPWPKGTATPPVMNMETNGTTVKDVDVEKQQLLSLLQQVQQKDSFHAHAFFGAMSKKDWGRLIWKHLDHHLRQFGV